MMKSVVGTHLARPEELFRVQVLVNVRSLNGVFATFLIHNLEEPVFQILMRLSVGLVVH